MPNKVPNSRRIWDWAIRWGHRLTSADFRVFRFPTLDRVTTDASFALDRLMHQAHSLSPDGESLRKRAKPQ